MKTWTENLPLPQDCGSEFTQKGSANYTAWLLGTQEEREKKKRKAVIICPGGGYGHLSAREDEPIARQYLAMGCHVFVLHYSLAPARFPTALLELALLVSRSGGLIRPASLYPVFLPEAIWPAVWAYTGISPGCLNRWG